MFVVSLTNDTQVVRTFGLSPRLEPGTSRARSERLLPEGMFVAARVSLEIGIQSAFQS
jgi:hypothetical protein